MKYHGFRTETLTKAAKRLAALGLAPSEVCAAMNLAGAKWRAAQIEKDRDDESYEESDRRVYLLATKSLMNSTMSATMLLSNLGHATEGEKFMFLAISLTLNELYSRGPRSIREWLKDGEEETNRVILSFAIGSCIIVEPNMIDYFFSRIVKFRYGRPFDSGQDISGSVLAVVEDLGKAGYSVLNAISD